VELRADRCKTVLLCPDSDGQREQSPRLHGRTKPQGAVSAPPLPPRPRLRVCCPGAAVPLSAAPCASCPAVCGWPLPPVRVSFFLGPLVLALVASRAVPAGLGSSVIC
jgi:hypothetical protein